MGKKGKKLICPFWGHYGAQQMWELSVTLHAGGVTVEHITVVTIGNYW